MTTDCITMDQIESRAATSVALAIYARRVRDTFVAVVLQKPLLALLTSRLNQLRVPLRSGGLEHLNDEQLREVATLLRNLSVCLVRLTQDSELHSHRSLKAELNNIEKS